MQNASLAFLICPLILGAYVLTGVYLRRREAVRAEVSEMPEAAEPIRRDEGLSAVRTIAPLVALFHPLGVFLAGLFKESSERMSAQLVLANLEAHATVPQIWTARVLYAVIFAGLFSVVGRLIDAAAGKVDGVLWVIGMLPGFFVGFTYPTSQLAKLAFARQKAIAKMLPFAFDLFYTALCSGQSFGATIRPFLDLKLSGPLSEEFERVYQELQISSLEPALLNMAARIRLDAFTAFAEAVVNSLHSGTSLVDIIKIQSEEMRKTRFNLAERQAAKAPTKILFPMILCIMPAVFIIIGTPVAIRLFDVIKGMS